MRDFAPSFQSSFTIGDDLMPNNCNTPPPEVSSESIPTTKSELKKLIFDASEDVVAIRIYSDGKVWVKRHYSSNPLISRLVTNALEDTFGEHRVKLDNIFPKNNIIYATYYIYGGEYGTYPLVFRDKAEEDRIKKLNDDLHEAEMLALCREVFMTGMDEFLDKLTNETPKKLQPELEWDITIKYHPDSKSFRFTHNE